MKPIDKDPKKDEDSANQPPAITRISKKNEKKKFDAKKIGAVLGGMMRDKGHTLNENEDKLHPEA